MNILNIQNILNILNWHNTMHNLSVYLWMAELYVSSNLFFNLPKFLIFENECYFKLRKRHLIICNVIIHEINYQKLSKKSSSFLKWYFIWKAKMVRLYMQTWWRTKVKSRIDWCRIYWTIHPASGGFYYLPAIWLQEFLFFCSFQKLL